jgi:hypothetical protein
MARRPGQGVGENTAALEQSQRRSPCDRGLLRQRHCQCFDRLHGGCRILGTRIRLQSRSPPDRPPHPRNRDGASSAQGQRAAHQNGPRHRPPERSTSRPGRRIWRRIAPAAVGQSSTRCACSCISAPTGSCTLAGHAIRYNPAASDQTGGAHRGVEKAGAPAPATNNAIPLSPTRGRQIARHGAAPGANAGCPQKVSLLSGGIPPILPPCSLSPKLRLRRSAPSLSKRASCRPPSSCAACSLASPTMRRRGYTLGLSPDGCRSTHGFALRR